jgi:NAD(P)-dependent dehydrogenase (short-subunit alcohol dehydrogenase family)
VLEFEKKVVMLQKVALVSGGNRGLGLQTCKSLAEKGYRVLMGCRDTGLAKATIDSENLKSIDPVLLDVCSDADIDSVALLIKTQYGRLDVLINNAGILIDAKLGEPASIRNVSIETLMNTLRVNTVAPVQLINALLPIMESGEPSRIVNVSSGMGQLNGMEGHYAGYRVSKTALNSATAIYAAELDENQILINAASPGWVRTDMGGSNADLSVEEGVDTIVWLATSDEVTTSGGFYRSRTLLEW